MRRLVVSLALGLTLAGGGALSAPAVADAYNPCPSLFLAATYHVNRGNVDYAMSLEQIGYKYGCGAFIY
jgi:hypothetical protein